MSPDASVMLRPMTAYRRLTEHSTMSGAAIALRRPLFAVFLLGCGISLLVSGRLTLRLIAGGAVAWSFVPILEVASFAAVHRAAHARTSFARDVDLFFAGRGPWTVWLLAVATLAAFATPFQVDDWTATTPGLVWIGASVAAIAMWSGYIDFCFFRVVFNRAPGAAIRALLLQRALCWTAMATYFVGFAAWPLIVDAFRR
jgi:hypothetical protein